MRSTNSSGTFRRVRLAPRGLLYAVLAAAAALNLAAAAWTRAGASAPAGGMQPAPPVRVLIVGNSYTYVNNLPAVLEGLAASANPARAVEVEMVAVGGATLLQHWAQGEARRRIRAGRWDYVVLQEQSLLGATWVDGEPVVSDPERVFLPGVRAFVPEIRAAGAKPLLFLTWARRSTPRAQERITSAYTRAARESGAGIVPAGLVWKEVRAARPRLELFVDDGSHPSPLGTYLAALAFYTTLFGEEPAGLTPTIRGPAVVDDQVRSDSVVTLVDLPRDVATEVQGTAARVWSALMARGGYPAAANEAAPAQTGALRPGRPVTGSALAGSWTGRLSFYTREMGLGPARVEMVIGACAGGPAGRMVLAYPEGTLPPDTVALRAVSVRDGIISFSIPFKHHYTGDVTFRGAFHGDTVRGVADYADPAASFLATGSWEVSRTAPRPDARSSAPAGCA